jgi:hypothetical protein
VFRYWNPPGTRYHPLALTDCLSRNAQEEVGMMEHPNLDSYAVRARICLGFAIIGAVLFAAVMLTGIR